MNPMYEREGDKLYYASANPGYPIYQILEKLEGGYLCTYPGSPGLAGLAAYSSLQYVPNHQVKK